MSGAPDISVIIPLYNAGRFIDRTMRCLVDDQFASMRPGSWEIIVVNDGSTDQGADTVRHFTALYPEAVRLVDQPNSGVSVARNTGIGHARGRYLYFMDADDLMRPGALPELVRIAGKTGVDILRFGHTEIHSDDIPADDNTPVTTGSIPLPDVMTARDFLDRSMGMIRSQGLWAVWGALLRRDFIADSGLQFRPGLIVGEDCVFMWQALLAARTVAESDARLYLYFRNPTGAINNRDLAHKRRMMEGRRTLSDILIGILHDCGTDMTAQARNGLIIAARNAHNESLIDAITLGEPLRSVGRMMRHYKASGMPLKPGRPRFYMPGETHTPVAGVRRWIAAYPMAIGIALSDFIRGKGLWQNRE